MSSLPELPDERTRAALNDLLVRVRTKGAGNCGVKLTILERSFVVLIGVSGSGTSTFEGDFANPLTPPWF